MPVKEDTFIYTCSNHFFWNQKWLDFVTSIKSGQLAHLRSETKRLYIIGLVGWLVGWLANLKGTVHLDIPKYDDGQIKKQSGKWTYPFKKLNKRLMIKRDCMWFFLFQTRLPNLAFFVHTCISNSASNSTTTVIL